MPPAEDPVRVDLHTLVPDPPGHLLGWDGLARGIRRRRRQRRAKAAALGVAVAVVAATGPAWWPTGASQPNSWNLPAAPGSCAGAAPGCGAGPGTPADLAAGRWVGLPAGPLSPRAGYGQAWTGSRLVIWGGQSASTSRSANPAGLADGASFDPASDTWQQIARSPLSARAYPAGVWTGRQVLFWGGQAPGPGGRQRYLADGAGYDPTSNTWRRIAPAPLSARAQAYGVWTGTRMIVFGGLTNANGTPVADGAAYDPASDSWGKLPAFPTRPTGKLVWTTAVWTGQRLLVWATYATGHGTATDYTISEAQVAAAWTPGSDSWQPLPNPPLAESTYAATAIWTGASVLFPHASSCPPYADCPPPGQRPVNGYDPATNTWHSSPPSVIATTSGPTVWTGHALMLINAAATIGGPVAATVAPGDGSAIDPGLTRWSTLPASPIRSLDDAQAVWTGHELLVWDGLSDSGAPASEALLPAAAPTSAASTRPTP